MRYLFLLILIVAALQANAQEVVFDKPDNTPQKIGFTKAEMEGFFAPMLSGKNEVKVKSEYLNVIKLSGTWRQGSLIVKEYVLEPASNPAITRDTTQNNLTLKRFHKHLLDNYPSLVKEHKQDANHRFQFNIAYDPRNNKMAYAYAVMAFGDGL